MDLFSVNLFYFIINILSLKGGDLNLDFEIKGKKLSLREKGEGISGEKGKGPWGKIESCSSTGLESC